MKATSARALTLLSCCGAALLAQDEGAVRIETLPWPLQHFDRGTDATGTLRIVDALTGRPLPGAALFAVRERPHPTGGEFWFDAKWPADADGFVRFPASEVPERCWFFVTADGHGPLAEMTSPPTQDDLVVELMPGIDWPVELRDVFDRPFADVELGLCLGCGHTPDVRVATSDREGALRLPCVETTGWGDSSIRDLYPRRDGVSPSYSGHSWQLGDPPTRLHLESAGFIKGRVLSPNGRPLPGIAITSGHGHRGPWSVTDAAGVFAALPNDHQLSLFFDGRQYEVSPPAVADTFDVVMPAEPLSDEQPKAHVTVVVQDEQGDPLPGARVEVWHVGVQSADPAESTSALADATGLVVADVVAGQLGLRVEPWWNASLASPPLFGPHLADLEVGADETQRVVVRLPRRTPIRIRPAAGVRHVTLFTRHDDWPMDVEPGVEREIAVPTDEVFSLRTGSDPHDARARWYVFSSPPTGVVELETLPPTQLRLRVVDERGAPVAAQAWLLDRDCRELDERSPHVATDAEGRIERTTDLVGCAFLRVVPDGSGLRPRDVHLALPRLGEGPLDLGDVVLPAAPMLRVLHADDSAVRGTFEVRRPGLQVRGKLANDGAWDGVALQAGDRVEAWLDDEHEPAVHGDDGATTVETLRATLRTTLTGEGPWTLREGSARLALHIVDDHGLLPRDCIVVSGAQSKSLTHQTVELRHLPAGECEVFVGARSCDSAKVRVRLQDGEHRRVDVVLRRRL